MWDEPKFLLCVMMTVKSIFQTGDVIMVYCLLLTPAKTQKQYFLYWPLASLALPGFDLFSSIALFKWNALQSTRLKEKWNKKEKDHSHGSYLRTGKIQSRTDLDPLNNSVFRSHEVMRVSWNTMSWSSPTLHYRIRSILVFTAYLIYNCLFDCYWTESMETILIHHWKCLRCMPADASQRAVFILKWLCSQSNHRGPPVNFLPTQWSAVYSVCQLVVLFSGCSSGQSSFDLHWQELSKIGCVLRDWSDRFAMTSYSLSFMCHHRKPHSKCKHIRKSL